MSGEEDIPVHPLFRPSKNKVEYFQSSFKIRTMKLQEVRMCALELPDSDRAALAADLLISLPAVLVDEDDGIAEARRRSKELDQDPSAGCSWEEIRNSLGR